MSRDFFDIVDILPNGLPFKVSISEYEGVFSTYPLPLLAHLLQPRSTVSEHKFKGDWWERLWYGLRNVWAKH